MARRIRWAAPRFSLLWVQCTDWRAQGVFITSGSFTSGARNYAQNLGGGLSLVLIDGERLARLMIKYRVGVQIARTYTVMKLDEDFFEES